MDNVAKVMRKPERGFLIVMPTKPMVLSGLFERKVIVSMPSITPTVIEIRIESINVSLKKNLCQFNILMFIFYPILTISAVVSLSRRLVTLYPRRVSSLRSVSSSISFNECDERWFLSDSEINAIASTATRASA